MKFFHGEGKLAAIFDIGSGSISGALVELKPGKKPVIFETSHKDIALQEKMDHKRFFSSMLGAFEEVSEKLSGKKGKETIDEIHCFFSAPWYASKYGEASTRRDEPFLVSEEILDEILSDEISVFEEAQKKIYVDTDLGVPKLIEKESIRISLNGYEVSGFKKREVKEASVSYATSVVPTKVLDELSERIKRRFHERKTHFHTFPFASFVVLRDHMFSPAHSFLFLDITDEVTDVLLVEDELMKKGTTFPLGRNFIFRRIAGVLHIEMKEAMSLFKMYTEEKVEKIVSKQIEAVLSDCRKEWADMLRTAFGRFSRATTASRSVFFVCDEDMASWFGKILKESRSKREQGLGSEETPQAQYLGKAVAKNLCTFQESVKKDVFLGVEAAFLVRFQNQGTMQ